MAYTTIDDPSAYFQTVLWTGNGSTQSITFGGNSDMQPDLLWTKCRSDTFDPIMRDTSRGIANRLLVHATDAEGGATGTTAFNSDGFSLDSTNTVNNNTDTYVAWGWKANGGTTSSVSASGTTLASTHQTDSTSKFCIMTWTGSGTAGHKVTHGLGSVPKLIIVKKRSGTDSWAVYQHKNTSAPETDYLHLDSTIATTDSVDRWNDTAPTSTLITLGDAGVGNASSATYVGYCWDEVQGYSKFGSYVGNGNADGPFVYTGFQPAWLLIKNTSDADDEWIMWDNKRSASNPVDDYLSSSSNAAESANSDWAILDFLSNGFKIRNADISFNQNTYNYIYMAFAESPFVSSEGVPCTAR